mgnify:CR=1 FL=1
MAKDRVFQDIGPEGLEDWDAINWQTVLKRVQNLRRRIFRATQNGQLNQVRSLTKLMLRSFSNLLLSVRKVTLENKGKRTPGIDRQVVSTPKSRVKLVREMLKYESWKVKPAKRVYIPKADGKQRPLGILTIKNRVAQAVVKNALEPYCEARFESHSYGFRPGRSCHDAIEQCWRRLNRHGKDRWVLEGDIKSAFDAISQEFIISELKYFPARRLIKQWLKAGYVEEEIFHDTTDGVQQGGVISPVLANMALDGMQHLTASTGGFVRYADDFIVTARRMEDLLVLKPRIEEWLLERGLILHPDKTKIVHIQDGFDFLGFNIRQYRGTCLVKPQKKKVLALLQRIRLWLRQHPAVSTDVVVRYLNPILNGWAMYYRHAVSKQTFDYVRHQVWMAIWKWCRRRHPNKAYRWIKAKYFAHHDGRDWRFHATLTIDTGERIREFLTDVSEIPIQRHIKVRGDASPDNPLLSEYWEQRASRKRRVARCGRTTASYVHDLLEA